MQRTKRGELNDYDKMIIRTEWRRSATLDMLASQFMVSRDMIADVLGLPKDEAEREKIHRETNFYDHGFGEERALQRKMLWQAEFLEEGDFEFWQKFCYMPRDSIDWQYHYNQVMKWGPEPDPKREVRRLWILNRFTEYQLALWGVINREIVRLVYDVCKFEMPEELRDYDPMK